MKISFVKDRNLLVLSLIILLACVLRFYGLTNQSLWVDELHTMIESDPSISWSLMFEYLKCCDPHPPLYFIIERFMFLLFGHTEGVARSLSAIFGVASVWAMYLLGKELLNQRLGLVAALLTSVNYYNIIYSQEARCYIMAFLFSVLSFVFFIKLIKNVQSQKPYLYALFALFLLYSHYFSLFIVAAQGLIAFVLFFGENENKKQFLKTFSIAGAIIIVGYLPWVPSLLRMSNVSSFWIAPIESNFPIIYFYNYFGDLQLIKPFLMLLLIYYCFQVFSQPNLTLATLKDSPLQLSFLVCFIGIAVTYIVPYLRSLLVLPMLFNRYTIVIVPLFLIAIAFAIVLIHNRTIQITILATFTLLMLIDLVIARAYYDKNNVTKTQFREMTEFISKNSPKLYPIVEQQTYWQHVYYLKKFNYNVPVFSGKKEATVDSILLKTSEKYDLDGFWIVGAHGGEQHLLPEVKHRLDTVYTLVKEKEFYDAWAQLYIRNINVIKNFPGRGNYGNEMVTPIWGGILTSEPFALTPGKYTVSISHRGTKAVGAYPHIVVYINNKNIGDFNTGESFTENKFECEVEGNTILKFDFDNDMQGAGEDRNAFIRYVTFEKIPEQ